MQGRYKLIESPEKMYELFEQYKEETKSNPFKVHDYVGKDGKSVYREKQRCLTYEGFQNFVASIPGMPFQLDDYFYNNKGAYSDFSVVCTRIKREIRQDQIEGGMASIYNPSITQRLNGLVDKVEKTVIQEQPLFPDSE